MKSLQILNNKYIIKKQHLEYLLEKEINSAYPDIDKIDKIISKLSKVESKEGYLNNILIQISNARNIKNDNNPTE